MANTRDFAEILWRQLGASIDMMERAIIACPEAVWKGHTNFWYLAYHNIFYLDYYLSEAPETFLPPSPFSLSEFEAGKLPGKVYSKDELLIYLAYARDKCHTVFTDLTDEKASQRFINKARNYSFLEILIYNLRHVQHHVGQLNLLLRQQTEDSPGWISQTDLPLAPSTQ